MQNDVACLRQLLQLRGGHAGDRDAIVMAELDHSVAVHVAGDKGFKFSQGLRIPEVV